jgi:ferredoxin
MTGRVVRIDDDRCQGHAVCYLVASRIFEVDDEGRGSVVEPVISDDDVDLAQAALDRCPEQAITMEDP